MNKKETKHFTFAQYNSPFDDMHLLIKNKRKPFSFLFDLGDISRIPNKDLLKVKYIFISHFHMDHFIGLSSLIRIFLTAPKGAVIHLFGPCGLIKKVSQTIDSYTWNLLDEQSFSISLTEIKQGGKKALFLPLQVFHTIPSSKLKPLKIRKTDILYEDEETTVSFLFLNHKTPVLGFKIISKEEILFNKQKSSLPQGIWIKLAKEKIKEKEDLSQLLEISPLVKLSLKEIKEQYLSIQKPKTYIYITDFLYSYNSQEIIKFCLEAEILFIENHFLSKDEALAKKTYHLSSLDVKDLVKKTKAKEVVLGHFSKRYLGEYKYENFYSEVMER